MIPINLPLIAGIFFGIGIGVAFSWADHIQTEREHAQEKEELAADLNAYRVMAEWDKFEQQRP